MDRKTQMSDLLSHSDALMPSQFYGNRKDFPPEKRLCLAVLEDALRVLVKGIKVYNGNSQSRMVQDARDWIAADRGDYPFSFTWVCQMLDLDADRLRHQILDAAGDGMRIPRRKSNNGRRVPITPDLRQKRRSTDREAKRRIRRQNRE